MSDIDKKTNQLSFIPFILLGLLSAASNIGAPESRERSYNYGIMASSSGEELPEVLIRLFGNNR